MVERHFRLVFSSIGSASMSARRPIRLPPVPLPLSTPITPDISSHGITDMPTIDRIDGYAEELTAIRRDLHAHPEIGFEEVRTSGIVAEKLKGWGIEVHRGLGGTGVVGDEPRCPSPREIGRATVCT